jgi:hypothetical protein
MNVIYQEQYIVARAGAMKVRIVGGTGRQGMSFYCSRTATARIMHFAAAEK